VGKSSLFFFLLRNIACYNLAASHHYACFASDFASPYSSMKLVGWLRFTWESKMLPSASYLITEEYSIRRATKHEKKQAWQVINSCFLLDTCWNDVLNDLLPRIRHEFEEKFSHREIDCLVITHGNRTIGASLIKPSAEISNHLLSGPCISSEYRNRGFGALLLKESLLVVAKQGAPKVFGVTRSTSPAAKFVYPKFGGTSESYEMPMGDVALAH
jgi:N-acetylglutamate synthase-like GNAT family acetyltransferase